MDPLPNFIPVSREPVAAVGLTVVLRRVNHMAAGTEKSCSGFPSNACAAARGGY